MQKQYYYSMKVILLLHILAAYISEGLDTTQTEGLYLIPINPVNGILNSSGSSAAGFGPEQAVDYTLPNSRCTYWNPHGLPSGSSNYFIMFDFTTMHLVTKLHIINVGDNAHDVTAFKLESSSNSLNWTDVARFFGQPGTHSTQKFGGFVGMNRYWKFTITSTISGQQPWLVEVGFYGIKMGFKTDSNSTMYIGNSTEAQAIGRVLEKSLQRDMYKYAMTQSPSILINSKDRSRSLKEPTFKYKHNISRTKTIEVPLDDVIDVISEVNNDTIKVMDSEERSRSLREPTFKYKHNFSRKTSTEVPLDDVIDEVVDVVIDGNTNVMEPKERDRSLEEPTFKYKHNISRETITEIPLDVIDNDLVEAIDDAINVNSTEMVPMIGTTKLITHMHVSSLNTKLDSFEDFFQFIGISQKRDTESGEISSNVIQVEKGKSSKYMMWLYLTLGLVLLGITLVVMGCIILQLIQRQNKLLASAIEINNRPITRSTSIRTQRQDNTSKAQNQFRTHTDKQQYIPRNITLPVTPV